MVRILPGIWENGVKIADEQIEDEDGVPVVRRHTSIFTAEEEAELQVSLSEADRGDVIPWEDVNARLLALEEKRRRR